MKRLRGLLLGTALLAGCATAGPAPATRTAFSNDAELAGAVRLCSWGNGAACDDLANRLQPMAQDDARARAPAGLIEHVRRDDASELASAIGHCRDGSAADCDRVAAALSDGVAEMPGHCRAASDCMLARAVAAALPEPSNTRVAAIR